MDILEKDLVYKIVGCAMTVHNTLGCGLREKTYERALCLELENQELEYNQQARFPVYYLDKKIDEFIPDLIVNNKVIVETKTVENIIDEHRGTLLNYLHHTMIQVGMIVNFKHPKLDWERLVLTKK